MGRLRFCLIFLSRNLSALSLSSPGFGYLLEGDLPSPVNPPTGCYFHTRCNRVLPICREEEPEMRDRGGGHYVACHNL
ncbi:MAG TPA: hypothetical protein GX744_02020 [Firmicutes bacterium]|nr:hypothetical protein [Bacillota bacterium]